MEDQKIVELYLGRDESAIRESKIKYGVYIRAISIGILRSDEDADECENDTYLSAWNSIPPQIPQNLKLFLGRITRNLSLDKYRKKYAGKRGGNTDIMLSELDECIPASSVSMGEEPEAKADMHELTRIINEFLKQQKPEKRVIFVKRYWYGMSIEEISNDTGLSTSNVSTILHRLRTELLKTLEKEGITV